MLCCFHISHTITPHGAGWKHMGVNYPDVSAIHKSTRQINTSSLCAFVTSIATRADWKAVSLSWPDLAQGTLPTVLGPLSVEGRGYRMASPANWDDDLPDLHCRRFVTAVPPAREERICRW